MPKDTGSQIAEGLIEGIKSYADTMGERTKLQGQLIANQIKARQNFFYRALEKQTLGPLDQQKLENLEMLKDKFGKQDQTNPYERPVATAMGQPVTYGQTAQGGAEDSFSAQPQPEVRPTASGDMGLHYPSVKDAVYKRIQQKKDAGMPLSPKEIKFQDDYLGIKVNKNPSPSEIHQGLKNAINTKMLQGGPDSLTPAEKFIAGYQDPKSNVKSYSDALNQLKVEALTAVDKVGFDGLTESQKLILDYKPAKSFSPTIIDKTKGEMLKFKNMIKPRGKNDITVLKNQLVNDKILPALGPDWETKAPEVKQYLDELYPEGGSSKDEIINAAWADYPDKSRDEVIRALTKKGFIK